MIRAAIGRVLRWFLDAAPSKARVRIAPADRAGARGALADIGRAGADELKRRSGDLA